MTAKYDDKALNGMRRAKDPLADSVIASFFPHDKARLNEVLSGFSNNEKLINSQSEESLQLLIDDIKVHYLRLNKRKLAEGRKLFDKHASDCMLLLGFLSLPYCYAASNGAEVLVRSERIMNEPEKRLSETAQFVFDVMAKDAFELQGQGLITIIKVRLMHAAVRWYIQQSGDWNEEVFGAPVNQEDMAGTNLSFSLMVIRGLRRLGRLVQAQEAFAYIDYWNQVGKMMGLRQEFLPKDNKESFLLEKRIRSRQFKQSEAGVKLAKSLFSYFNQVSKGSPLEGKVGPFANFLLGAQVCQILDIRTPESEQLLFKPYQVFMQFSNQIINKADSYGNAYLNYKKQIEGVELNKGYAL